jgi:hypothetical protein
MCASILAVAAMHLATASFAQAVKMVEAIEDPDLAFVDRFIHQPGPGGPLAIAFNVATLRDVTIRDVVVGHPDLDGDGAPELLVVIEHSYYCGTVGCPAYLFTPCKGRYLFVDEFTYEGMWLTDEARGGWRTFLTDEEIWRWDGLRYVSECRPAALQCLMEEG